MFGKVRHGMDNWKTHVMQFEMGADYNICWGPSYGSGKNFFKGYVAQLAKKGARFSS